MCFTHLSVAAREKPGKLGRECLAVSFPLLRRGLAPGKVRDALDGGARRTGQAGGWLAEAGNGPASAECVFRLFTAFP